MTEMYIQLNDTVQIKALLPKNQEKYTVSAWTQDREGNTMFELENEDGYLLDDLYYPSQLVKVEY